MAKSHLLALLLMAFSASYLNAQIDTERIPPEQDSNDLYRRAAASRFVLIGTVVHTEGVSKRLTQSDIEKMKRPAPTATTIVSLDGVVGGSLYTIQVENTLCRQADFRPTAIAEHNESIQSVSIFLPRDEPMFVDGHQREILLLGQRYLFFLVVPPSSVREKWLELFQLDRNQEFYRGEELTRGIVPLPHDQNASKQPPLLETLTKLCQALRPPELAEKLAALRILARSDDPVLRREAAAAEAALRHSNH